MSATGVSAHMSGAAESEEGRAGVHVEDECHSGRKDGKGCGDGEVRGMRHQ